MKRLILNTVLLSLAITVGAQTSRRQSGQTEKDDNKAYQRKETSTKSSSDRSSTNNRSTNNDRSNNSVKSTSNDRSNNNEGSSNKNRGSVERSSDSDRGSVERSSTNRSASNSSSGSNPTRRESSGDNNTKNRQDNSNNNYKYENNHTRNETRVYHTDRVYSTPATHVHRVYVEPRRHHHAPATRIVYRTPLRVDVVWDTRMHNDYCVIYPYVREWRIERGTRIETISAYDAVFYIGEVKRVYGLVRDVYYEPGNDEYQLYIGDRYPYQDFTVIIPGYIARSFSRRPLRYFQNQYLWSTGYITEYENKPEMVINREYQIGLY